MKSGSFNKIALCITGGVLLFCTGFYCRDAMTRDVIVVEPERTAAVLVVSPEPSAKVSATVTVTVSPEPSMQDVQESPTSIAEDEATGSKEATEHTVPINDGLIDLNSASQEELETLPGIGPVLAQRIIEYREQKGGLSVIEEVLNVSGIGEKKYDAIKDLVKVEE